MRQTTKCVLMHLNLNTIFKPILSYSCSFLTQRYNVLPSLANSFNEQAVLISKSEKIVIFSFVFVLFSCF